MVTAGEIMYRQGSKRASPGKFSTNYVPFEQISSIFCEIFPEIDFFFSFISSSIPKMYRGHGQPLNYELMQPARLN